jgi:uncharacterized DUF497 family protein
MSLASTLTLRINAPPSALTKKKDRTPTEEELYSQEERERWEVVADAASKLVVVASTVLGVEGGMREVSAREKVGG